MSYQVLARKWRPRNFEELVGQGHVLKTLINALENGRLHHAYLFTGTRGVGKTTIARILARCLNCEAGITAKPCGECSACKEISEGRFIDLIEVDAASRTKVEDTRELLDNVQYSPSRGRFKIYLIDEVHMLSNHSFNALLKTLEEPPPHVKFLLATTDPQKLPVTILSRCLQFNLKNLTPEKLVEHLVHILRAEKIDFEESSLWQLGRAAQGSARDCLTLLDQAIGFCEGALTEQAVGEFLGNLDHSIISALMEALISEDAASLLSAVARAAEDSPDFTLVLHELQAWLQRVAIAQVLPEAIDNTQGERDELLKHAATLPAEKLHLFYQIALKGREEMPWATDARSGLEMTLLRMLAFVPAGVPHPPTHSLARKSRSTSSETTEEKKKPLNKPLEMMVRAPSSTTHDLQTTPGIEIAEQAATEHFVERKFEEIVTKSEATIEPEHQELTALEALSDQSDSSGENVPSKSIAHPSLNTTLPSLDELNASNWLTVFNALPITGITQSLASNMQVKSVEGTTISLFLDTNKASLYNEEQRLRLEQGLNQVFLCPIKLEIFEGEPTHETPAQFKQRILFEQQQDAEAAFTEHPLVQSLQNDLGMTIVTGSIKPIKFFKL